MITLAHISDVHLAPLPPVRWTELLNKRMTGYLNWRLKRHTTLSGDGLTNLVRHMKEQEPDFVAVTGDLVNLGLAPEANTAWNWLQTVGEPDTVCVAPGNHDTKDHPTNTNNKKQKSENKRGETVGAEQFPFVRRVGDVALITCTSSVPTGPFMAYGRFDEAQAQRLRRILKLLGNDYFRVILIHHPPNQEARSARLGLHGAKRLRQVVAECGAELILHGHTHKSTIYAIPGLTGDVPVIGVAAAGAAQSEDGGEDPARYNLFKIERLGTAWSCSMREFGFQRLSPDIVLRLSLRIY